MEDVQKETPPLEDQAPEPADVGASTGEEEVAERDVAGEEAAGEAGPCAENEESEGVEVEVGQTLTCTQVISRLKAIVLEIEGGSLVVGGVSVGRLAESVEFELEYAEKDGEHEIEIELKWR